MVNTKHFQHMDKLSISEYGIPTITTIDTSTQVTDMNGRIIVDRIDIDKGDFSFTAKEGGEYSFCFYNRISECKSWEKLVGQLL